MNKSFSGIDGFKTFFTALLRKGRPAWGQGVLRCRSIVEVACRDVEVEVGDERQSLASKKASPTHQQGHNRQANLQAMQEQGHDAFDMIGARDECYGRKMRLGSSILKPIV